MSEKTQEAGALAPWTVGELPPAPQVSLRSWMAMLGPGVMLAGASIGSGEWLAGPGISAQYGGTLLWVATLSIIFQVFCNIEFMRYALYCGEPIIVGFFRSWPGPWLWLFVYLMLDFGAIWPFNASNAAVPLAAAFLGHLPGEAVLFGSFTEQHLVKYLGFAIFLLAFLPLIFGGTIYKMLERIMTFKLVVVLIYLTVIAVFMVSPHTAKEVGSGFFRFGALPLRASTVVSGRHFSWRETIDGRDCTIRGTMRDESEAEIVSFTIHKKPKDKNYSLKDKLPVDLLPVRKQLVDHAVAFTMANYDKEKKRFEGFLVRNKFDDEGFEIAVRGSVRADQTWEAKTFSIVSGGQKSSFDYNDESLKKISAQQATITRAYVENQGVHRVGIIGYLRKYGRLPDLDWALIAVFAAIAGAGGMTNVMFSNYSREKGWGMGAHVGAIPSAVGGRNIRLSHVGQVFEMNDENRKNWRGWIRHILRDQLMIWMVCSFVGMALPCMLSLEFVRHAPVSGPRVAAMSAEGMAARYPEFGQLAWLVTLLVGFLVLAPGQIMSGDVISRRWTDIIWTATKFAKRLGEHQVKLVYYAILSAYGLWGLFALIVFGDDPFTILKIAGVLMNFALSFTSFHAIYVNCTLLPKGIRPNWIMIIGGILAGTFFFSISVLVLVNALS